MSDFYSRCLVCGVDLPRGCSFCTEAHKLRWRAEHDEEARPVVMIDEWPFVERETVVSGADQVLGDSWNNGRTPDVDLTDRQRQEPLGSSPITSGANTARQSAADEGLRSQLGAPAVCSGWACHDPKCTHPNCNPAF